MKQVSDTSHTLLLVWDVLLILADFYTEMIIPTSHIDGHAIPAAKISSLQAHFSPNFETYLY